VKLNGENYPYSYLKHSDIVNGGTLEFVMTNQPSSWGTDDAHIPKTEINEHLIVPVPYIAKGDVAFKGSTEVVLENVDKTATIFYAINDSDYQVYKQTFQISEPSTLSIYSENSGKKSAKMTTKFYKIDPNVSIVLETDYANQYNGGGTNALIDGIFGTQDFRTGTWQGYQDTDLNATVNLGNQQQIETVSINFLEDQRSWIFYPTEVICYISSDGKTFQKVETKTIDATQPTDVSSIKTITFDVKKPNVQYVKITAKTLGELPKWHLGYEHDGRSWLFVDEITVN
jgi:hypothetical protein